MNTMVLWKYLLYAWSWYSFLMASRPISSLRVNSIIISTDSNLRFPEFSIENCCHHSKTLEHTAHVLCLIVSCLKWILARIESEKFYDHWTFADYVLGLRHAKLHNARIFQSWFWHMRSRCLFKATARDCILDCVTQSVCIEN